MKVDEKGLDAALEAWAQDWRDGPPEQDSRSAMRAAITAYEAAKTAEKPVERREGFVTFYELLDGQVAVLHPNFPPHIWDGGKMVAIAPPQVTHE